MDIDINIPKTKSVNIFFQFSRLFVYLIIATFVINQQLSQSTEVCSGSLALLLLNVISLIFIWLKDPFARLEFFVMYAVNICWTAVVLAETWINMITWANECQSVILAQKVIFVLHIKIHLEVFMTFIFPLPFPFRFTALPTTLLPLYIIFTSLYDQTQCSPDIGNIIFCLFFINFLLIGIGGPINASLLCTKNQNANNAFKFLVLLGCLAQGGLVALMFGIQNNIPSGPNCQPSLFAIQSYILICPITIACALLFIMTIKTSQQEDIRNELLKARQDQVQNVDTYNKPNPIVQTVTLQNDFGKDNVTVSHYGTISRK